MSMNKDIPLKPQIIMDILSSIKTAMFQDIKGARSTSEDDNVILSYLYRIRCLFSDVYVEGDVIPPKYTMNNTTPYTFVENFKLLMALCNSVSTIEDVYAWVVPVTPHDNVKDMVNSLLSISQQLHNIENSNVEYFLIHSDNGANLRFEKASKEFLDDACALLNII